MKPLNNIIAPIDFSQSSINALKYAVELAIEVGATLHVYHSFRIPAVSDTAYPIGGMYPETLVDFEEVKKEVQQQMEDIEIKYLSKAKLKYHTQVESGFVAENIINKVNKDGIDLIVMGTRGTNALQKLFGSTTTYVINHSDAPTLVIPKDTKFEEIESLILASDYKSSSKSSTYDMLIKLADVFHARIKVIHVHDAERKLESSEIAAGEGLRRVINKVPHEFHFENDGLKLEEALESQVQSQNKCMLVMVPHKHSLVDRILHGSKTQNMIFKTQKPLLVLKE